MKTSLERLGEERRARQQIQAAQPARASIRSPYRDYVTMPIVARVTFTPDDLVGGKALKVRGTASAPQSMKPVKALLAVRLVGTYGAEGRPDEEIRCEVSESFVGLTLLGGSFDGRSLFPPRSEVGAEDPGTDCCEACHSGRTGAALSLSSFNNPLGCGVSWPRIEAGAEAWMDFGITKDVVHHISPPDGYDRQPKQVTVEIEMTMYGEPLR